MGGAEAEAVSPGQISPPAIIQQANVFDLQRCRCPRCAILDARFPDQGFQLALFPYRMQRRPKIKGLLR